MLTRTMFATLALTTIAILGCEETVIGPGKVPLEGDFAFITATDFQTGSASVIAVDSVLTATKDVAQIHSDAVARFFDGLVYVVNRYQGDNILVLDPSHGFDRVRQFSVGNGSDPHDFLLISRSRAFVTRYNETEIWIVDPTQGKKVGDIDLSWVANGDPDLIPEMDHMTRVGDHVFVSVQRVNRNFIPWSPVGASYLVVIDAYTYQVVDADPLTAGIQPLRLTGANPYSELVVDPVNHQIIVSTVGRWNIADGGLERVNPSALSTGAFALTESQAGGEITDVVMVDANRGAAIVTDASFNNLVIGFDFTAPADIDTIYAPGSFAMQDAELSPDGLLFVTDRTPVAPGIRVFRSDTWSQLTTSPIDVGLPPFDIEFGRR